MKELINDCYNCIHKREVPGDAHIRCANPDPTMLGSPHGVRHGWFFYPFLYDPVWMLTVCSHYTAKQ